MSAPADAVDWDRAEREERRRQVRAWPLVVAWFGGMALLRGGSPFGSGRTGWALLAGYLLVVAVLVAVARTRPGTRERAATAWRAAVALRLHADPGPGVREVADRHARTLATRPWLPWVFPLATVVLVLGGRWDSPVPTACGTVLMVAAAAVGSAWWRRQVAAAQRWVADPPGPLRDAPAATRLDRWTSGRGLLWPVLALVVAGVGAGLLAALLA